MKNLKFIQLAKKAFREGSDIFGETITGYVSSKLEQNSFQKNLYTITLRLKQSDGTKCGAGVGFKLISLEGYSSSRIARELEYMKCDISPYNKYVSAISGHEVFTVPVTKDMLDFFPRGLDKKSLDEYTWQELEEKTLELKKKELAVFKQKLGWELQDKRKELGLNTPIAKDDLPF